MIRLISHRKLDEAIVEAVTRPGREQLNELGFSGPTVEIRQIVVDGLQRWLITTPAPIPCCRLDLNEITRIIAVEVDGVLAVADHALGDGAIVELVHAIATRAALALVEARDGGLPLQPSAIGVRP